MMKDTILLLIGLGVIIGSIYLFLSKPAPVNYQQEEVITQELWRSAEYVKIGEALIRIEIADTPEEISLGLSGRESLEEGSGLLFIMPTSARHGFWMKDMRFPIDIIWIDENWVVVDISREVRPETFPEKFSPRIPAQYVLEVPAGTVEQMYIDIGQEVYLIR